MKLKLIFIAVATVLLAGCATYTPEAGSPQVIIHAPVDAVKNHLVNDLVNKKWNPVTDSEFTVILDRAGGFWQDVFFGSQWNAQTVSRINLTFINTGDGTRVIWHECIVTNPGSGFQQMTEVDRDWPQVQYWLDCMAAELENRPRPPQPIFPEPKPTLNPHAVK
jgi:hypothetical protein